MPYNEEIQEKELLEFSERINNTPKPDCIDEYIKNGIKLGELKKKRNKVRAITNVAALITFVILLTSIRISPVLASYISKIPGLQYIVSLVNFDKGVSDAVNNNFIQPINISQEHEGLVFTLKDILIDNSKAVLFYSIENKTNHKHVNIAEINLKDANGKQVISCSSMGLFMEDISKKKELVGKVEFTFSATETIIPDVLFIDVKLQDEVTNDTPSHDKRNVLASTWKFNIPIDKEKFKTMKKVYTLNQTIEIEGQKILFKTVTITPTLITAEIEYDTDNSKKILRYDDISIINENGETWATITNSVGGFRKDENHETLFFQSNYFTNPKELYIKGTSIKALDKDKLKVIVDVDKKILLKAPDDKLSLKSVTDIEGKTSLDFQLLKDQILDKDQIYFLFESNFEDSNANLFYTSPSAGSSFDGTNHFAHYNITTDCKLKSPIYFTIFDYPTRINGDFKVKIK